MSANRLTEKPQDARRLESSLAETTAAVVDSVHVFATISSTNTWLSGQPAPLAGRCRVALAEHQDEGRGRLGRTWLSEPGASLCLSAAFTLRRQSADLSGLTLALAIAVVTVLERMGADRVQIKWPNDLVLNGGKLGGILTELRKSDSATTTVVVGLGLNLANAPSLAQGMDGSWAARPATLAEVVAEPVDSVELAAAILDAWVMTMAEFDRHGFAPFKEAWSRHDYLLGKTVTYEDGRAEQRGRAAGVATDGALLVERQGSQVRIVAGEIRIVSEGSSA